MYPTSELKLTHGAGHLHVHLSGSAYDSPRAVHVPVDDTLRQAAKHVGQHLKSYRWISALAPKALAGDIMAMRLWNQGRLQATQSHYQYELEFGAGPKAPRLKGSAQIAPWFTTALSWATDLVLSTPHTSSPPKY